MSDVLIVGETNKAIVVNAGYDLTTYTEITLLFTKPDLSQVSKTITAAEISIGAVDLTIEVDGVEQTFNANEYVVYRTEVGFLDQYGKYWKVCLDYENSNTTPPTTYKGKPFTFEVLKECEDTL